MIRIDEDYCKICNSEIILRYTPEKGSYYHQFLLYRNEEDGGTFHLNTYFEELDDGSIKIFYNPEYFYDCKIADDFEGVKAYTLGKLLTRAYDVYMSGAR